MWSFISVVSYFMDWLILLIVKIKLINFSSSSSFFWAGAWTFCANLRSAASVQSCFCQYRRRGEEGKRGRNIYSMFLRRKGYLVRTYLVRVLLVVSLEYYCMVLCSTVLFLAMKSGVPGTRVLRLLLLLLYDDDDVCDNRWCDRWQRTTVLPVGTCEAYLLSSRNFPFSLNYSWSFQKQNHHQSPTGHPKQIIEPFLSKRSTKHDFTRQLTACHCATSIQIHKLFQLVLLSLTETEMQSVMSTPAAATDPAQHSHDPNNAMIQLASASEQYANSGHNHMHNASSFVDSDAAFAGGSAAYTAPTNTTSMHGAPQHNNDTATNMSTSQDQIQSQGQDQGQGSQGHVISQNQTHLPPQTQGMTNFGVNNHNVNHNSSPVAPPHTTSVSTSSPGPSNALAQSAIREFVIPYPSPPSENLSNKKKRKVSGGAKAHQVR